MYSLDSKIVAPMVSCDAAKEFCIATSTPQNDMKEILDSICLREGGHPAQVNVQYECSNGHETRNLEMRSWNCAADGCTSDQYCSLFVLNDIGKKRLTLRDDVFVGALGSVHVCVPSLCSVSKERLNIPSVQY